MIGGILTDDEAREMAEARERGRRRPARSLMAEPSYPGLEGETVLFSIRYPMLTAHAPGAECDAIEPHPTEDCPMWRQDEAGERE